MSDETISPAEQLIVRTLIALQAETELASLKLDEFMNLIIGVEAESSRGWFPSSKAALDQILRRMARCGYIELRPENPHLGVTVAGFLTCAPLPIPEEIQAPLEARCNQNALR